MADKQRGRPSTYKLEYGVELIKLMDTGLSLMASAAKLDIPRRTITHWRHVHPDFDELVQLAKDKRMAFLEERLLNDSSNSAATTATIFALKNSSQDWRQDQERKLSVDQTIEHKHTLKLENLSEDQLESLVLMLEDSSDVIEGEVVD